MQVIKLTLKDPDLMGNCDVASYLESYAMAANRHLREANKKLNEAMQAMHIIGAGYEFDIELVDS